MPAHLEALLANVHEEVRAKYYGCGIVVPAGASRRRVLDLGSGSGRDVYLMSQLVGPEGEVVGVDMTDEQLATANAHVDWHMRRVRLCTRAMCKFLKGYIEKLGELGLEPQSFDVVVSNCVINLSVDKLAVLRGAYDLLKPGGELYFADVYCDRRLPDSVTRRSRCSMANASAARSIGTISCRWRSRPGFLDPRLVDEPSDRGQERRDASEARPGASSSQRPIVCSSSTGWRAACEDYGQAVIYKGTVPEQPDAFELDGHHLIERGKVFTGLRQYLAHAGGYALRAAFRFHRRFLARITGSSPAAARRSRSPRALGGSKSSSGVVADAFKTIGGGEHAVSI